MRASESVRSVDQLARVAADGLVPRPAPFFGLSLKSTLVAEADLDIKGRYVAWRIQHAAATERLTTNTEQHWSFGRITLLYGSSDCGAR